MNSSVTIYEERIPEIAVSVTDLPLFRIQTFDPVTVPRVQKGMVFDWVRFLFARCRDRYIYLLFCQAVSRHLNKKCLETAPKRNLSFLSCPKAHPNEDLELGKVPKLHPSRNLPTRRRSKPHPSRNDQEPCKANDPKANTRFAASRRPSAAPAGKGAFVLRARTIAISRMQNMSTFS